MDANWIIHVDIDAFFAAVEQVLDPALAGRAVIVGGGIGGRGVIASCSYEARTYGLKAGMPIHQACRLCPDGVYLPPRFGRYNRFSERVFGVLADVSPSVQQTSLDDAYVDLAGCERMYAQWGARPAGHLPFQARDAGVYVRREGRAVPGDARVLLPEGCRWPAAVGRWIKARVRRETGLTVSVGMGSNKLMACIASALGKPNGLVVAEPGHERDLVAVLDLKDVPGIGRATRERLHKWNVRTVRQAQELPAELLEDAFGPERGPALHHLLNGQLCSDAAEVRAAEAPRSISRETTFWTASNDYEFVESMLFYLTERLGRALRRQRMEGRTVQVKLRYADNANVQCSRSLGRHTDRDEDVFAAARRLLRTRWCRTKRLRLVGVSLTDLRPMRVVQYDLFEGARDRSRRIDRCLDGLRDRFGFDVVHRGLSINLAAADTPEPARP